MEKTPFLLLFLLLSPGHGCGSSSKSKPKTKPTPECPDYIQRENCGNFHITRGDGQLYVNPLVGLQNITLHLQAIYKNGDSFDLTNIFKLNGRCFPGLADWWEVTVKEKVIETGKKLQMEVWAGECREKCIFVDAFFDVQKLRICPSNMVWKTEHTNQENCGTVQRTMETNSSNDNSLYCITPQSVTTKAPPTTTPTTATPRLHEHKVKYSFPALGVYTTIGIVAGIAVGGVLLMALMMAKKHRERTNRLMIARLSDACENPLVVIDENPYRL